MKQMMVLLAATLVLSAGSFAQTSQPKKMDTTHKSMKKPMRKKPMKKMMDSTSMSTDSSTNPMK